MNSPDVLIVGSGAAGSLFAQRLSKAGKKVLILEAGEHRSMQDLISSQIWARRLKYNATPVKETGTQPIGHNFNNAQGTGGAAMHHYGVWPRLHENDFNIKTKYNLGNDWPITYQDLQPHYDSIQSEVGIAGDHKQEIWRPKGIPYNQIAIPTLPQGQAIAKGFAKLGMQTAPIPMAVLTQGKQNRKPCIYDGWCDAGCPIGSLANPLATYLSQAIELGAKIINRAVVTKIQTNTQGDRVTGVHYIDQTGQARYQSAKLIIVAASAVQNARLLLASKTAQHPHGLSNYSGRLGSNFMIHLAVPIYGIFPQQTAPHLGLTGGQLINQDGYKNKDKGDAFGSYQWLIANAMKPNGLLGLAANRPELYGTQLDQFIKQASQHLATMISVIEEIPLESNRIKLLSKKDNFGTPLVEVEHSSDAQSLALAQKVTQQGLDIFNAANASDTWHGQQVAMHNLGGTLMGTEKQNSITNSYGQSHEINNLFIAGSSLFPSGGGVNPTFSIHAITQRAALFCNEHWQSEFA